MTVPTAWDPVLEPPPSASPGSPSLAAALQAVLAQSPTWRAERVLEAFDAAMVGATPTCPGFVAQGAAGGWVAECTSGVGTTYDGYLFTVSDGPDIRGLWGAASLALADGTRMRLAGSADFGGETLPDGTVVAQDLVRGTFEVAPPPEGDPSRWGWLTSGSDLSLFQQREERPDGGRVVLLEGAIGGLDGVLSAVDFEAVRVESGGGSCAVVEPTGKVGLRDLAGDWHAVDFDGDCDGCGVLTRADGTTEALCLDAGGALADAS